MKIPRKGSAQTRKSLLIAATDIFANKGYRDATIAEICARAGANIAAVNYHFKDKESLYREAWRYSFVESVTAHPPDGGVADDAPPEERLRGMIGASLHRIADGKNKEFLIVHKELASPTGLLGEVMHKDIRPLHDKMEALVRELLGPRAKDEQVQFSVCSIISQCMNPMLVISLRKGHRAVAGDPPGIGDLDTYADHVVRFSLAGMRAQREGREKKDRTIKKP